MTQTRRQFLTKAGLVGGGIAVGGATGFLIGQNDDAGTGTVPFHGAHQAGILTPQQDRLQFAAFDVTTSDRHELQALLAKWTAAASRLTTGAGIGEEPATADAPPTDTGEAAGLLASRLTITFGLGPSLFERDGEDRFGLAGQMPKALRPLPSLPGDEIDPAISHGDLCIQACADDPQVAFHAIRNLTRIGRGVVTLRWSQVGFGRTSSTSRAQDTPRNLMGFKDGTNNITAEDSPADHARHLWVSEDDGSAWMAGGTYLVTRRIRMLIEVWDRASLNDQEATIGRFRPSGAPLTGTREHDKPNYRARTKGEPTIPADAHIRHAAPENNAGIRMLRRGYSFTDGFDPVQGQLDSGLFFIAYQRDPHRQFVPVQKRLGLNDALNEYIVHRSSALFAIPPGVSGDRGDFIASGLFA